MKEMILVRVDYDVNLDSFSVTRTVPADLNVTLLDPWPGGMFPPGQQFGVFHYYVAPDLWMQAVYLDDPNSINYETIVVPRGYSACEISVSTEISPHSFLGMGMPFTIFATDNTGTATKTGFTMILYN